MSAWAKVVGAITLFVEDLQRAKSFYRDDFALRMLFEDDDSAAFDMGGMTINLLKVTAAYELIEPAVVASLEGGSRFQLSIFVGDVDAVCEELAGRGVKLLNGPINREWGMRTAAFADPAGHIWEVAQEIPAEASP